MRMDVDLHICNTFEDTYNYMKGSAAIIGDFMLPILIPGVGPYFDRKRSVAQNHAKDLGRAFQLTNMIRDIEEDLDLRRQYIPENLCKKHNIKLQKRDYTQLGWGCLIEDMFKYTEQFYVSGDIGILMLPNDIRNIIMVARKMYYKIHDKIRENNYNIFSDKRIRVTFPEKVKIASEYITHIQLFRIVLVECVAAVIWNFPLLFTLILGRFLIFMSNYLLINECWIWNNYSVVRWFTGGCGAGVTYMQFHCIFTFPILIWLYKGFITNIRIFYNMKFVEMICYKKFQYFLSLCVAIYAQSFIATLYTIPWDNMLVYKNSWSYPSERVLFCIGYVPIEEYMFFGLDALIVCGIFLKAFKNTPIKLHSYHNRNFSYFFGGLMSFGGFLLFTPYFYLASIILWSTPVIYFQTWWDYGTILKYKRNLLKCILTSTMYLTMVDHWALERGIWKIENSLFDIYPGMPFEECFFFFVTSTMCSFGFLLTLSTFGIRIKDLV